jgi:hypothetical protein
MRCATAIMRPLDSCPSLFFSLHRTMQARRTRSSSCDIAVRRSLVLRVSNNFHGSLRMRAKNGRQDRSGIPTRDSRTFRELAGDKLGWTVAESLRPMNSNRI